MSGIPGAKNTLDLAQGVWSSWFLYGDSGTGKTTLASSFPRPVFLVPRVEGSVETLRGLEFPYFEISSMHVAAKDPLANGVGSMEAVLDYLEQLYDTAVKRGESPPFDTIVVESLSHVNDMIVADLTQNGALIMDQGKWGLLASRLMSMHVRLKRLECHVVYTALAKLERVDDKQMFGGPLLSGAPAAKLPAACSVVGYVEKYAGQKHRVHFTRYQHWHARSRFRGLPKLYQDAFDIFYSQIEGSLGPESNTP